MIKKQIFRESRLDLAIVILIIALFHRKMRNKIMASKILLINLHWFWMKIIDLIRKLNRTRILTSIRITRKKNQL